MPRLHRLMPLLALFAVACNKDADEDGIPDDVDCAPDDAGVAQGAAETCDGVDNDCDGQVDEADASDAPAWHADFDGDGFGAADWTVNACAAPEGYVEDATDCDDADASANPDGGEVCDGVDNDCDGSTDEDASDAQTFYADNDNDGFGGAEVKACEQGGDMVTVAGDCDDGKDGNFPGAPELCDGVDNDCDGTADGVDVPGDYGTIAEALTGAPGALICLAPGEYAEPIYDMGAPIHIGSTGGSAVTTLDLSAGGISLSALDSASLRGLTLTGSSRGGTAVYVESTDHLHLQDLVFTGNDCSNYYCQSVLHLDRTDAELRDVWFKENNYTFSSTNTYTYASGGTLFQSEGGDLTWIGGGFTGNDVDIAVSYSGSYAQSYAGPLLYVYLGDVHLEDLLFNENVRSASATGTYGYAYTDYLLNLDTVRGTLSEVTFLGNEDQIQSTSTEYGYSYSRSIASFSSSILDIYALEVKDNVVDATISGGNSGAYFYSYPVYFSSGEYTIDDSRFADNETTFSGTKAAGYAYGSLVDYCDVVASRLDLSGNSIEMTSDYQTVAYGPLYLSSARFSLENGIIAGNEQSSDNGYAYATVAGYYSDIAFTNVAITHNSLQGYYAGAILQSVYGGSWELTNTSLDNNEVEADSSAYDAPAAIVAAIGHSLDITASYNNVYGNTSNNLFVYNNGTTANYVPQTGDVQVDPGYVSTSGKPSGWDLHLQASSPLVDAGSPDIEDTDGTRSDIGAYGGPGAAW